VTIFRSETCGSYEKKDDTRESPTNAKVASAMPSRRIDGLTKTTLISQSNNARDQAICAAAIEIGAESASKKSDPVSALSR